MVFPEFFPIAEEDGGVRYQIQPVTYRKQGEFQLRMSRDFKLNSISSETICLGIMAMPHQEGLILEELVNLKNEVITDGKNKFQKYKYLNTIIV